MIVNIRGSHGSGKSTVARAVMARGKAEPIYGVLGPRRPEAYAVRLPQAGASVFVVGPYQSACGGCDQISSNAAVMVLVEKYAAKGHVLFEGSLVSSCYGAVGRLLEQRGMDSVFVFLNTPLEECIRRVEKRRGREPNERLIKNVTMKYDSGWRVHKRIVREGKMRAIITSTEAAPRIVVAAFAGT